MLRIDNAPPVAPAIENRVNELPSRAKISPTIHAIVARAIWPDKTAENWAAAAGKEPSVGKVWLRGNVSGDAKLALIRLLG
jgi:hypothetical protein